MVDCEIHELGTLPYFPYYSEQRRVSPVWFGDIDGDQETETLFTYASAQDRGPASLCCYSQDGDTKWCFEPGASGDESTDGSLYRIASFLVATQHEDDRHIVVSSLHSLNYDSRIVLLDSDGRTRNEFRHSGYLPTIQSANLDENDSVEYLLGGFDAFQKRAALVVVDFKRQNRYPESLFGKGDEEHIEASALFPRTCINKNFEEFNAVGRIMVNDETIEVAVSEGEKYPDAHVVYVFDHRLRFLTARFSDSFRDVERHLTRSGQMDPALCTASEVQPTTRTLFVDGKLEALASYEGPQRPEGKWYLRSIGFDGEHLWTSMDRGGYETLLHKHDPSTLEVKERLDGPTNYLTGMTFVGSSMWSASNFTDEIIQHSHPNPDSIAATYDPISTDGPRGLAYGGGGFWAVSQGIVYRLADPPTKIIGEYRFGFHPDTAAWHDNHLWTMERDTGQVRKHRMDDKLSVIATFQAPEGFLRGEGICFARGFLWLVDTRGHRIFKCSIPEAEDTQSSTSTLGEINTGLSTPSGLDYADGQFWVADCPLPRAATREISTRIYRFDPNTGSRLGSIPSAVVTQGTAAGILVVEDSLFQPEDLHGDHRIHRSNRADGSPIERFSHSGTAPAALATDGTYLYVVDSNEHWIQKRLLSSPNYPVIAQFPHEGSQDGAGSQGLTFAEGFLFMVRSWGPDVLRIDPNTGQTLEALQLPESIADAVPMDLAHDGEYFWIMAKNGRIYRAPKSWGGLTK